VNGSQQLVGLGGLGLIAVNFWTGDQRTEIAPVLGGKGTVADAHSAFKEIGAELLFVVIATMLAGLPGWGAGMVAVIVALYILWGINHYSNPQPAKSTTPATTTTAAPVMMPL
jgi:hypothetical protein